MCLRHVGEHHVVGIVPLSQSACRCFGCAATGSAAISKTARHAGPLDESAAGSSLGTIGLCPSSAGCCCCASGPGPEPAMPPPSPRVDAPCGSHAALLALSRRPSAQSTAARTTTSTPKLVPTAIAATAPGVCDSEPDGAVDDGLTAPELELELGKPGGAVVAGTVTARLGRGRDVRASVEPSSPPGPARSGSVFGSSRLHRISKAGTKRMVPAKLVVAYRWSRASSHSKCSGTHLTAVSPLRSGYPLLGSAVCLHKGVYPTKHRPGK